MDKKRILFKSNDIELTYIKQTSECGGGGGGIGVPADPVSRYTSATISMTIQEGSFAVPSTTVLNKTDCALLGAALISASQI